ncbi:unnamed protein product [Nippostrongylus brasiliensis]|uniref:adenylate cyclase n=1 Tax=Nippostrongylus brasiliensis TaxID=27835 RepID=A0A0N4YXH5_NIPBR|nr:unnamed protein product [Nippostrongylus brasiliensis]
MYEENFEGGREFLRVLNEVIGDFDELLDRPEFCHVEKIKTIGAAYMAASGLNPEQKRNMEHPKEHLYQMVEFALAIQHVLSVFNEDLLNFDFVCKLGLNIGPVTAGVIGTTKLYYDIWGDTVNIASRMYSTGVLNRIQVSAHTRDILLDRYEFEYRDHIEVKGIDGGMDTYLLIGRKADQIPPAVTNHVSNADDGERRHSELRATSTVRLSLRWSDFFVKSLNDRFDALRVPRASRQDALVYHGTRQGRMETLLTPA